MTTKGIVMLDRDGTLNVRIRDGYLLKSDEIERAKDLDCLIRLEDLGFQLCVVTNQACVSKNLIDIFTVKRLTQEVLYPVTRISESQLFVCCHQEFENCLCRKPKPKLLQDCLTHNQADSISSFFIGDSPSDMEAAKRAGVRFLGVCWDGECMGPACSHTLSGAVEMIIALLGMEEGR
jgi:D-glycero-D-manno-heptose 1,7-bisphosphate phosphatase